MMAQRAGRGSHPGKEEWWLVTAARAGASLGIGLRRSVADDALRAAALDGSIIALMEWFPVKAGDFFHIPPGTIHAIGAGVDIIEVQQNADVTYRLHDYGRGRELHLDAGIAVARRVAHPPALRGKLAAPRSAESAPRLLTRCPHFSVWHAGPSSLGALPQGPLQLVPLSGEIGCANRILRPGAVGLCEPAWLGRASGDFACLAVSG